jgi:hypothetical protein
LKVQPTDIHRRSVLSALQEQKPVEDTTPHPGYLPAVDSADRTLMYGATMDVFLNRWFTSYDDARAAREAHGGYLFPYREHFFVAEAEAVRELGLDPADPDWQRIGWDWVRPLDRAAWERLWVQRAIAA